MEMDLEGEKSERRESIAWERMKPSGLLRSLPGLREGSHFIQGACAATPATPPSDPVPASPDLRKEVQSKLRGSFGLLDKTLSQQPPDLSHHPIFHSQPLF